MEDKTITLYLENGETVEYKVLFTFHHDERNEDYVLIYDEKSPDDVMLFRYFEDNTLAPVEDDNTEILEMAQELLDMYDQEELGKVETNI